MKLALITEPNPMLTRASEEIKEPVSPGLIDAMANIMEQNGGGGLAAIQVGIPKRFFIVNKWINGKKTLLCAYNPKIVEYVGEKQMMIEGCLSIPGMPLDAPRSETIKVEYLDKDFQHISETLTGFDAQVFQHETDHTNGITLVDYQSEIKKLLIRGK